MSFGKYDSSKDMLDDYMMYNMTTGGGSGENNHYRGKSSFPLKGLIITVLIIIGIVILYDAVRPQCAHPGCDNSPAEGSSYCLIHDSKYYHDEKSYSPIQTTTATTNRPVTTTAAKTTTKKTTTTHKKDEYDAHDYNDPEDFYEDHYDDFFDYEDAEDYWDEYNR